MVEKKSNKKKFEWNWTEFFTLSNISLISLAILGLIFRKYILLAGGLFFILFGFLLVKEKKNFQTIIGAGIIFFGFISLTLFFTIIFKFNLSKISPYIIYALVIFSTILYIMLFLRKKDKDNLGKIFTSIIFIAFVWVLYKILIQQMPRLLKDTLDKGLSTVDSYIFAILFCIIIIFMLAEISKRSRFILKGNKNNYLDILIGIIILILFCGYYLIAKIETSQLQYFLGIIAAIFLVITSISSLKHIIEKN